ncbi:Retroviral aspartyl protease [Popillia japonica]|uniref:RNA-directed DNA polymerase n=1 Tax=Popillia japonica TaxID=7064 RepID=A0AAW1M2D4_POPJA
MSMPRDPEVTQQQFETFYETHRNDETTVKQTVNSAPRDESTPNITVPLNNDTTDQNMTQLFQAMTVSLQQNTMLLNMLMNERREDKRDSELKENYNIMPDFSKSVQTFTGENFNDGKLWLDSIESTARLHRWPEPFILETAKNHLIGPARHWYEAHYLQLSNWSTFKTAFQRTFVRKENVTTIFKKMSARIQGIKESNSSYFHDKIRLCNALNLTFDEVKEQIVVGLRSRELASMLIARHHHDEDELFKDVIDYERINAERQTRFQERSEFKKVSIPEKPANTASSDTRKPARNEQGQPLCFTCKRYGHVSKYCRSKDTVSNSRPAKNEPPEPSRPVMLCEQKIVDVAPYLVDVDFNHPGNSNSIKAILDTGSPISIINKKIVSDNYDNDVPINKYEGINNVNVEILGIYTRTVYICNVPVCVKFHVVPESTLKYNVLLGRDFIYCDKFEILLTPKFSIRPKNEEMTEIDQILQILVADNVNDSAVDLSINSNLTYDENSVFHSVVDNYLKCDKPPTPKIEFVTDIRLANNHESFHFGARRLSQFEKIKLQEIIDDLLRQGIIRESNSPYSSPTVLVKKKTGDIRLCIDFRELNKYAIKDRYPLPLIDDQLDKLKDKKVFTKLDLRSAFHHVKLTENSCKYTAFVTCFGQFEYTKLPFGFCNSPSIFSRYINLLFKKLLRDNEICIFLDDILIATQTVEENLDILKKVLNIMAENCLQLRLDKCYFGMYSINYLGYTISEQGISPSSEHVEAVTRYPVPNSTKALHSFIGLISYFRRFIPNFSVLSKPLYDLLKRNVKFEFGPKHLETFEFLKSQLASYPVLAIYSPIAETELHCDASVSGFGAVLVQKQADSKFHPIAYFSKRTTDVESRYHSLSRNKRIVNFIPLHILVKGRPM